MARETKTIQCYPDDSIINSRIKQYESFGWELINNQRCQEYDGQTKERDIFDGSTTTISHYSTFNKLTFSRDKGAPWYSDVVALESKYEQKENERKRIKNTEPSAPSTVVGNGGRVVNYFAGLFIVIGVILIAAQLIMGGMGVAPLILSIACPVFGILVFIIRGVSKSSKQKRYTAALQAWKNANNDKLKQLDNECKALMDKAAELIG